MKYWTKQTPFSVIVFIFFAWDSPTLLAETKNWLKGAVVPLQLCHYNAAGFTADVHCRLNFVVDGSVEALLRWVTTGTLKLSSMTKETTHVCPAKRQILRGKTASMQVPIKMFM